MDSACTAHAGGIGRHFIPEGGIDGSALMGSLDGLTRFEQEHGVAEDEGCCREAGSDGITKILAEPRHASLRGSPQIA